MYVELLKSGSSLGKIVRTHIYGRHDSVSLSGRNVSAPRRVFSPEELPNSNHLYPWDRSVCIERQKTVYLRPWDYSSGLSVQYFSEVSFWMSNDRAPRSENVRCYPCSSMPRKLCGKPEVACLVSCVENLR